MAQNGSNSSYSRFGLGTLAEQSQTFNRGMGGVAYGLRNGSRINMQNQPGGATMPGMKWMMYLMPVMFLFFFNDYASGLSYYYFISLLFSALTMWWLRRTTDDAKLLAKLEANYEANKNNPNKKPSGLAARLEALQKQQEEIMKRQQNLGKR